MKKRVENKGIVPQYYVENVPEPSFANRREHDLVVSFTHVYI